MRVACKIVSRIQVVLALCVLLVAPAAWAQATGEVSGTITDASDGRPLTGANVVLTRPGSTAMVGGAATGVDGRYQVRDLAPGAYTMAVRFVGFQEATAPVTVAAGQVQVVDVALQPGGFDLNAEDVVFSFARQWDPQHPFHAVSNASTEVACSVNSGAAR